jgi:hypothetical protein
MLHFGPCTHIRYVSNTGTRRIRVQTYPVHIGGKKIIFYSKYGSGTARYGPDTIEGKNVEKHTQDLIHLSKP